MKQTLITKLKSVLEKTVILLAAESLPGQQPADQPEDNEEADNTPDEIVALMDGTSATIKGETIMLAGVDGVEKPADNGLYMLADGRVLHVAEGKVADTLELTDVLDIISKSDALATASQEVLQESAQKDEEIEGKAKEIKDLKTELSQVQVQLSAVAETKAELETKLNDLANQPLDDRIDEQQTAKGNLTPAEQLLKEARKRAKKNV